MAMFEYHVKDSSGKDLKGFKEAEDLQEVISELKAQNCVIIKVKEAKGKKQKAEKGLKRGKITLEDLLIFVRQMATLINAGVPLVQSLEILSDQSENLNFRTIIKKIKKDVEGGQNLSESLALHKKVFSALFVCMVRAGESSGSLDDVLERLAIYTEKVADLQKKIKSAMMYPAAMFGICILISVLMMTFIVPKFAEIFKSLGAPLPMPTQVLINVSDLIRKQFLLVAGGLTGFFFLMKYVLNTKPGRFWWHGFQMKMPIFGQLILKSAVSKFTRTLGSLIKSGVPILSAIEIVGEASGNVVIEKALIDVRKAVQEGENIAGPLERSGIFPSLVIRMVAVGEETGELEQMLNKIADFFDSQVDTAVEGLSSLIEPLVIAFLGIVIGGIVVCMFLPILSLSQAVKM